MDNFQGYSKGYTAPADIHYPITPNDDADLPRIPRVLHCTVAGNVVIRDKEGTDISYPMVVGQGLVFRARRILATGTTATVVGQE